MNNYTVLYDELTCKEKGFLSYQSQMQIMAIVCAHREYFGIRENIEAFPVGTRPLAPMK